jgi:signal recognition particle subunit SRP54
MFESLSDRFEGIFGRLRAKGTLRQSDVEEALREIRLALLEADVNVAVVRTMLDRIRTAAAGAQLHEALNPSQQVIKLVNEALIDVLGGEALKIRYASKPPTVVLMAGLQGSGKTTSTAKLARWFRQQGRNPLLVGADLQRPAAVEQLRTMGERAGAPVFSQPGDPVKTARAGLDEARRLGRDVCIIDTAGRLAIDAEMMQQVAQISKATQPDYTFLVVDAMTGQDAVTVAESFNETLALDGVILTKLDGDARGGAALSVKEVVGKPIAFASTGEKLEDFDLFHPDRLAGRILGMGDVLTLIEKAEQVYEKEQAEEAASKLLGGDFTLEDLKDPYSELWGQISTLRREMGEAMAPRVLEHVKYVLDILEMPKIGLFSHHRSVMNFFRESLNDYGVVEVKGGMTTTAKQNSVDEFIANPWKRIFSGQLEAAGFGIDGLQNVASHVILAEPAWTPGVNEQVIDRFHRDGQHNNVLAQFMVTEGSIAERILGTYIDKSHTIHSSLDKVIGL